MNLKTKPCPDCGKLGLHYPPHPHARRWKDYERVVCRFCGGRFKVIHKEAEIPEVPTENEAGA